MVAAMNKRAVTGLKSVTALIVACLFYTDVALSTQQYSTTVLQIQSPASTADCLWFTLSGVPQADPILPNNPWFAIPRTQNGFGELYAMLLSAKLSGSTVWVSTTGAAAGGACGGYAGVSWVVLQ